MYNPVKDGVKKSVQAVQYTEAAPPADLVGLVHSFWELRTETVLTEDFSLHVLPDACVNILFNLFDTRIAAVTARQTTYVALNLGKTFHYAGIQFLPGVWQGDRSEIATGFVDTPYTGKLPLVETGKKLAAARPDERPKIFAELVTWLVGQKLVAADPVTANILADLESIETVADMAASANLSPRQLQRSLRRSTGFSPHDFLKILRLQQSFRNHYRSFYADQSHFIHSFRKITGYTPAEFFRNFDV